MSGTLNPTKFMIEPKIMRDIIDIVIRINIINLELI